MAEQISDYDQSVDLAGSLLSVNAQAQPSRRNLTPFELSSDKIAGLDELIPDLPSRD